MLMTLLHVTFDALVCYSKVMPLGIDIPSRTRKKMDDFRWENEAKTRVVGGRGEEARRRIYGASREVLLLLGWLAGEEINTQPVED